MRPSILLGLIRLAVDCERLRRCDSEECLAIAPEIEQSALCVGAYSRCEGLEDLRRRCGVVGVFRIVGLEPAYRAQMGIRV